MPVTGAAVLYGARLPTHGARPCRGDSPKEDQPMARKKNAAEIKEPDEYRGLVRLAMLDFRGRHRRKPHDFEEFWEWCHQYGSDELFREANSQVRPPGYLLLAK